jgi:hypothetical protein
MAGYIYSIAHAVEIPVINAVSRGFRRMACHNLP